MPRLTEVRHAVVLALALPATVAAQIEASPVLTGSVLLGERALASGTVVLHHMDDQGRAGEIDSTLVGADGSFSIPLPGVPNPALGDLYFASVRHSGVMYFGLTVENAAQLDSLYTIQVYDTLLAPLEGADVKLQARNIFLEPNGGVWQATDVFQLLNEHDRTIVARPEGRVWSYPLPEVARDVMTGEGEFAPDAVRFEGGEFVVRAALPPGERLFVVRYVLDSPAVAIPSPGEVELFDVLVREPAPVLDVDVLRQVESIDLEAGQTFRRYAGQNLNSPVVRITIGETSEPPPVQWIAVVLAVILGGGGLLALRRRGSPAPAPADDRRAILVQIARLDEEFETRSTPSAAARREYQHRRAELMRRLNPDR